MSRKFPYSAVELIVAIIALIKCELSIVQSSLIGSILSNILLVLGEFVRYPVISQSSALTRIMRDEQECASLLEERGMRNKPCQVPPVNSIRHFW